MMRSTTMSKSVIAFLIDGVKFLHYSFSVKREGAILREVIQSIKLIIIEVPAFRVKLKYGVRQNNLKVFTQSLGLRPETFDYGKRKNCTSQILYVACRQK